MSPVRPPERFLVFGAPLIEQAEIDEVVASLRSGWIGTGPKVQRFQQDFAAYKGVDPDRVVAVSSCTAALHLSLLAAEIGPGDEVITTPLTFCATANAIVHAGATPVLADIDPHTLNIDPAAVEASLTPRTRAILPVHFAGRPCEMDALRSIAARHDLRIIEDCAHAIETEHRGGKAGTFGDFGCFSFYVTKNVVTGEGGMILAPNAEAARRLQRLALHGMSQDAWRRFSDQGYRHYDVVECGFKYNMMDLQAALGIHQLARVERCWQRRRAIWDRYQTELAGLPVLRPPPPAPGTRHAFHLYTIQIDPSAAPLDRDRFLEAMTRHNIGLGVHYRALPDHPAYERFGWRPEAFPHATRVGRQTASLPISARLQESDVSDVIEALQQVLQRGST